MQWCCNPPDTKSPATYLYLSSSANCDHIGFFAEVNGVSDGDADYDADIYYDADGDGGAWRRTMSYLPLSSSSRRARILKWVQLYTALDFIWVKHPLMPLWRSRPSIPWEKNLFAFSTPLLHRHDSQTQLNECWQNQFLPTWKRFSGRPLKGQWHKYCELPIQHCKSHSSTNYPSLVRPARLSRPHLLPVLILHQWGIYCSGGSPFMSETNFFYVFWPTSQSSWLMFTTWTSFAV